MRAPASGAQDEPKKTEPAPASPATTLSHERLRAIAAAVKRRPFKPRRVSDGGGGFVTVEPKGGCPKCGGSMQGSPYRGICKRCANKAKREDLGTGPVESESFNT